MASCREKALGREKEKVEKRTPQASAEDCCRRSRARNSNDNSCFKKSSRRKTAKVAGFLLSLNDGNQLERLAVPKVHIDQLAAIVAKYPWSEFDEHDNRMWEYMNHLMAPAMKKAQVTKRTRPWLRLNRAQKVFYTMLTFSGETDNGGVWQFLFNEPQLSLAALEAMEEIGESKLASDYKATLEELLGKAKTISDIQARASIRILILRNAGKLLPKVTGRLPPPARLRNTSIRWLTRGTYTNAFPITPNYSFISWRRYNVRNNVRSRPWTICHLLQFLTRTSHT